MRKPVVLDLNNLPADDYSAMDHHKQPPHLHFHHSSSSSTAAAAAAGIGIGNSYRKKNESSRRKNKQQQVYECRFCSLKFCKSQALGGHMNLHRQEKETETLIKARQLVFGNHNPNYQLGIGQPMVHRCYHNQAECNMGSRLYTPRLFSSNSTALLQPVAPCMSLPSVLGIPNTSRHPESYELGNDYFLGPVCSGNPQFILRNLSNTSSPDDTNNYTCIGAPVTGGNGE